MTTGGSFSRSLSLSSDQVFDRTCTLCEEDDTTSEAECYCTVCCKYYCSQCQGFHDKVHRDHREKMLDKDAMLKSQPETPARASLTTMCEEHHELVQMYCGDHNVVCCTVCVALRHKKCEHTDYIPKVAEGCSKNPSVAKVLSDLQTIRKDVIEVRSSRQEDKARIQKDTENVVARVKDFRRRMNAVLDRLDEVVVTGTKARYDEYDGNIQADLEECDEALGKIEKSIHELGVNDTSNKTNEAQLFVQVKQAEEKIGAWLELSKKVKQNVGRDMIKFVFDGNIEIYLKNLQKLGDFVGEIKASSTPLSIQIKENPMVRMKEDNEDCNILGACWLPDNGALLSDCANNKLKRIDSSFQIIDNCSMKGPAGVCYIEEHNQAAVSITGAVNIVSLGSNMAVIRSINMDEIDCYGVAYSQNHLYVTEDCGRKLYALEWDTGRLKDTVSTDKLGNELFSNTRHVSMSNDGAQMLVADVNKGLIVLGEDYNLLRVINDDDMGSTRGVCVDNRNNIFVCCAAPNAVLQFDCDGQRISTILRRDDLKISPVYVCYDNTLSRMLVTTVESDAIIVLHFK